MWGERAAAFFSLATCEQRELGQVTQVVEGEGRADLGARGPGWGRGVAPCGFRCLRLFSNMGFQSQRLPLESFRTCTC